MPEHSYRQVNPAEELEKVARMAESVRGFRLDGEGGGKLLAQGDVDMNISVAQSTWEDTPFPMLFCQSRSGRQRIYLHQAFLFHPDTVRDLAHAGAMPADKGSRTGRIFVVDTGWVRGTPRANAIASTRPWDIDPITDDVAHEHGPAICDIIQTAASDAGVTVELRQIRFDKTSLPAIPMFTHDDPHPKTGAPMFVRGFSEDMLIATLEHLSEELVEGDVVNLSLGATAHPEALETEGDRWLYNWLKETTDNGVKVVAAAGNHGTTVPTWPAAHGTGLSPFGQLEHVYAVGSSASGGSGNRHAFSAHGWVPYWENGSDVRYTSTSPSYGQKQASWDGTSFAAPQFAVGLLPRSEPGRPHWDFPTANQASDAAVMHSSADVAAEIDVRGPGPAKVDLNSPGLSGRLKTMTGKFGRFRKPR